MTSKLRAFARKYRHRARPMIWLASGVQHLNAFAPKRRWRARLSGWAHREITPLLQSTEGDARLDAVVADFVRRIDRALLMLDGGAAILDEARFTQPLHYACVWLGGQEDVAGRGMTLRAYSDITASLAAMDRITTAIAAEFSLERVDVALRLGAALPAWREPLILAGRCRLEEGRIDDAIDLARRAFGLVGGCPSASGLLIDAFQAKRAAGGTLDAIATNGTADLRGRFCARPFDILVSSQSNRWNRDTESFQQVAGTSYLCDCAAWLPFPAGNVIDAESPNDVWNSAAAQEIRRSILDGDYSYCSRTLCPLILNDQLPKNEDVASSRHRRIIDNRELVLADEPHALSLGHDTSCNLACPSCRPDILMADREENQRLERARDRVILPMLRGGASTTLHLTAWGDPFGSRHYRSIIEELRSDAYRGVGLYLLTNGLLLTRQQWDSMPHLATRLRGLRVSVDAATKETYEDVRRPGRWEVIEQNLRFFGDLHRQGFFPFDPEHDEVHVSGYLLCFVVQSANFREMPAFVRLAREVGADCVIFQKYFSFGHENSSLFEAKDIASPAHPRHHELLEVMRDPELRDPRVAFMQLDGLLDRP